MQYGLVIVVPYKNNDLWENMTGVLMSGGKVIDIVKVNHMSLSGHYFVIGDSYTDIIEDDMYLGSIYIKTEEGKLHQLKFNQWKSAINGKLLNNPDKPVPYELIPSTFQKGYYLKLCVNCGCHFSAGKKQQYCEECAEDMRPAKIVTEKPKRPRIKSKI
jgi:hypothetical protein